LVPIIYLHGFASGPQSSKAQFFRGKFEELGVQFEIPQLDENDFEHLTVTRQLAVIDRSVSGRRVILMGSSLGGYLAALYAARHSEVERLILLAPAFQFPRRWRERYSTEELDNWRTRGSVPVFHYGQKAEVPLGYQFMEDSENYENQPDFRQPALIIHGTQDSVVPAEVSTAFAANHSNVRVVLLVSGHELTDVLDSIWAEVSQFIDLPDALFQKRDLRGL